MGAQFDSATFPACSTEQLKTQFKEHCEELIYQHGHDAYGGHMGKSGLQITSKVFKDANEAQDWLENNTEKWGSAKAVQVGDFTKAFPQTAGDKKLATTFTELEREIKNWDADILKRVKAGKSLQRSCDKCNSKITLSFLKTNDCPVCHNHSFLQTDTDTKKFKSLQVKFSDVSKKYNEAKKKHLEKAKPAYWFVGAWCSS